MPKSPTDQPLVPDEVLQFYTATSLAEERSHMKAWGEWLNESRDEKTGRVAKKRLLAASCLYWKQRAEDAERLVLHMAQATEVVVAASGSPVAREHLRRVKRMWPSAAVNPDIEHTQGTLAEWQARAIGAESQLNQAREAIGFMRDCITSYWFSAPGSMGDDSKQAALSTARACLPEPDDA